MNMDQLTQPQVYAAVAAMNTGNREAWTALFAPDAVLTDDGNTRNFLQWSDSELFGKGKGRLTSIDRVEDNGCTIYGTFHSDQWGTFNTFFKFHVNTAGKIDRLDVGQAG